MIFSESLKKNRDFRTVYRKGKSYANKYLVMYIMENHQNRNRLGISVSKKVGNSVVRHRIIRLVRESYRLHENIFNSGLDIVVVARGCASEASYEEIKNAMLHLGRLHKILSMEEALPL
ncbi:MAG: ribonuclease P protein component [Lachnospiraceae bacterium]|jgi:ribonuclease P protein component|nr:ribonuclease P protein component [Lachnospiraceae bacterium]